MNRWIPTLAEQRGGARTAAMCAVALAIVVLAASAPGFASPGPIQMPSAIPVETGCVTDGQLFATAFGPDGTAYVGGPFNYIGPRNGCAAPVSLSTGKPPASFPMIDGEVRAIAPDGSGGFYLGGTFSTVGGQPRKNLVHVLADLTVDPAFLPDPGGPVLALERDGARLYVGGLFAQIGSEWHNCLAALDPDGHVVWAPEPGGAVYAIEVVGTTVFVGGSFNPRNLMAFDTTGTWLSDWHPDADQPVYALAGSGDTLYAGGGFTRIGDVGRNHLAALDISAESTGAALPWDPNADNEVYALAVRGSTVYAGGVFHAIGATPRSHVAAMVSGGIGALAPWDPNPNDVVYGLALDGTTVYAAGGFSTIGGRPRRHLAAIDSLGNATSWAPNSGSNWMHVVALSGSTAYVGGVTSSIGGELRSSLAAVSLTGTVTAWDPSPNGYVYSLAASGTTVYVGGNFSNVGGASRLGMAALDAAPGSTGTATGFDPRPNALVTAIAVEPTSVLAGGYFTRMNDIDRGYVAQLDPASGAVTGWDANANGAVQSIAVAGTVAYAGGAFTHVGGADRARIAALDISPGSTGTALGWDPGANSTVRALAVAGPVVYAGGDFTSLGGLGSSYLGALDAGTGLRTLWDPVADGSVSCLAVGPNAVYAGGSFHSIGGATREHLAALDPAGTGQALAWDPQPSQEVYALALHGSSLLAGGVFGTVGGKERSYLALFEDTTPPVTSATVLPASGDGDGGWYKTAPSIGLSTDESATSSYRWDTGAWQSYDTTLTALEGSRTLGFYSTDTPGNTETAKSLDVRTDSTPPSNPALTPVGHTQSVPSSDTTVRIDISGATDAASGPDGYAVSWSRGAIETPDATRTLERTDTSFTSPRLATDGSWWANLRTRDVAGNWSAATHAGPFVIDTAPPGPPANLSACAGDENVQLAWAGPAEPDLAGFRLLRSTTRFATAATDTAGQTPRYEGSSTLSADTGLTNGTTYFYTLFARDTAGNWSTRSATATALPKGPTALVMDGGPSPLSYGGRATFAATLTYHGGGLAGATVTLWRRNLAAGSAWSQVAAAPPRDTHGVYSAVSPPLTVGGVYKMRYAGDAARLGSDSGEVTIRVRAYLSRPVTPATVRRRVYFTTYGYLKPRHTGYTKLYFYRYNRGYKLYKAVNAKNANYSTYTKYSLKYRLPYAGKWLVKAYHGDADHAGAFSPLRYLSVR